MILFMDEKLLVLSLVSCRCLHSLTLPSLRSPFIINIQPTNQPTPPSSLLRNTIHPSPLPPMASSNYTPRPPLLPWSKSTWSERWAIQGRLSTVPIPRTPFLLLKAPASTLYEEKFGGVYFVFVMGRRLGLAWLCLHCFVASMNVPHSQPSPLICTQPNTMSQEIATCSPSTCTAPEWRLVASASVSSLTVLLWTWRSLNPSPRRLHQ